MKWEMTSLKTTGIKTYRSRPMGHCGGGGVGTRSTIRPSTQVNLTPQFPPPRPQHPELLESHKRKGAIIAGSNQKEQRTLIHRATHLKKLNLEPTSQ